jgi:hypothetical protein
MPFISVKIDLHDAEHCYVQQPNEGDVLQNLAIHLGSSRLLTLDPWQEILVMMAGKHMIWNREGKQSHEDEYHEASATGTLVELGT